MSLLCIIIVPHRDKDHIMQFTSVTKGGKQPCHEGIGLKKLLCNVMVKHDSLFNVITFI